EGGLNYILDAKTLVARKKVIPGDPANSKLLKRITAGEMPPEDEKPRPSEKDIAILTQWIQANASPEAPTPPPEFITTGRMLLSIHKDLTGLNQRDRQFARYFTITHLYNASVSEDELQTYRNGLAKLVNSLSWGRQIVVPKPIDRAKTIL